MWEFTVPWGEYGEESRERKKILYDELLKTCKNNGGKASWRPTEVGSKELIPRLLYKALFDVGLKQNESQ